MKEIEVKANQGFNLICVAGFEFEDDEQGVSFNFGDWFEDQEPEFKKVLLLGISGLAMKKAEEIGEEIGNENVRAN